MEEESTERERQLDSGDILRMSLKARNRNFQEYMRVTLAKTSSNGRHGT